MKTEGLLCLDTARDVGWSFARPAEQPEFGSHRIRPMSDTDVGDWLYYFEAWLLARINEFQPRYVCYLTPIRRQWDSTDRLQKLFGLTAVVRLVCKRLELSEGREIFARHAEDATVCKFFTGKGKWGGRDNKKRAVMDVCRRYGWDTGGDDNAADSLALLVYAEHKLFPQIAGKRPLILKAA